MFEEVWCDDVCGGEGAGGAQANTILTCPAISLSFDLLSIFYPSRRTVKCDIKMFGRSPVYWSSRLWTTWPTCWRAYSGFKSFVLDHLSFPTKLQGHNMTTLEWQFPDRYFKYEHLLRSQMAKSYAWRRGRGGGPRAYSTKSSGRTTLNTCARNFELIFRHI